MDKTAKERMKRYRNRKKVLEIKKIAGNEGARLRMVRYRGNHKIPDICEACGHKGVTDIHHEGKDKAIHYLCPNCHAQITRGKIALKELRNTVTEKEVGVTAYHPVMEWLIDPVKRGKLGKICEALGRCNLQDRVYLGCGRYSLSLDIAEYLLEATG